jgi:hypothetical protein
MLVSVTGLGSIWRRRFPKAAENAPSFARAVYYNTTGVAVDGRMRQRPRITGYARFDRCGGFDPNYPQRMVGRVFECAAPCVWQGDNKLWFRRLLQKPQVPDRYLVVARTDLTGTLTVGANRWRSADTWLLSFSECGRDQEALLLMARHSWFRTELGRFVLEPDALRPWIARLLLTCCAGV